MLKIYNDPNSNTNLMAHTRLDSNQIVSTAFCNCRYDIVTPPYGLPLTITDSSIPQILWDSKSFKKLAEDR